MPSNVPLDLASLANALDPSVQAYFKKQGELVDKQYPNYVFVDTDIPWRTMTDGGISGLTQFGRVLENAVIEAESQLETNTRSYVQVEFANMVRVTRQNFMFNEERAKLKSMLEDLRKSAERKKDRDMADLINNATSTSYTVTDRTGQYSKTISGGDSVAASSASHTREDGRHYGTAVLTK